MTHRWRPTLPAPSGLVRPVRLDPDGVLGPTRCQARTDAWRRVLHGWYVPATTRWDFPEQWIIEQSVRLPGYGAVTGWAACRLHGAAFFDGLARDGVTRLPIDLNVGPSGHLSATPLSRPVNHLLHPTDRELRHGIRTVVPVRAAYDAARLASDARAAVVAIDMATAGRICSLEQVRAYATWQHQDRARVLAALDLASEHTRSPRETDVRLIAQLDGGLTGLLVNPVIYAREGQRIAEVDLLDVRSGLVIEVDGADHRTGRAQANDHRRDSALRAVGLEVCRVAGGETVRPRLVAERIWLALARCAFHDAADRRWVARPQPDRLHDELTQAVGRGDVVS